MVGRMYVGGAETCSHATAGVAVGILTCAAMRLRLLASEQGVAQTSGCRRKDLSQDQQFVVRSNLESRILNTKLRLVFARIECLFDRMKQRFQRRPIEKSAAPTYRIPCPRASACGPDHSSMMVVSQIRSQKGRRCGCEAQATPAIFIRDPSTYRETDPTPKV